MNKKSLTKERLPFLLGSIPILLAGFDSWEQNDNLFFSLNIIFFLLNMLGFCYINKHSKRIVSMSLFLNAIFILSLSFRYFSIGRVFIPYVCIVIGLGYLIALLLVNRKIKNKKENSILKDI